MSANYSKSIKSVLLYAFYNSRVALSTYFHKFSRKDFTAPQLFALLVLRAQLKTDFRGVVAFVRDFPAVSEWLGLKRIPHPSTLCRAAQRISKLFPAIHDQLMVSAQTEEFL